MSKIEATLCVYGKPGPDFRIIAKDAAINAAQKAKEQGKILDYRVVEESETTGKIIAAIETDEESDNMGVGVWIGEYIYKMVTWQS
jgi:uncharacterized protein (DUF736 family)